ncbi:MULTISPECIES: hypothetical protein [Microbacterium]|uniref:hypothetical protein n=1 Tax=Microbacterium TaxID=33882 RepID=UPI002780CD29|nr:MULTISPECIES: hypothetical protein [Microbacterium]MDQ1073797.1 very-short-patch-repair endonuclease [Microbacterium sp. SORGH_AS_0969]MDQ1114024.1 very-short-patch-repair endonuclease [Microbacterium testaceum]
MVDEPRIFSVRDAVASGRSRFALRHVGVRAPYSGVRSSAAPPAVDDLEARAAEYVPLLRSGQFFSHETALGLLGVPLPPFPFVPGIHVSAHRPVREPRVNGILGHRLQARDAATLLTRRGWPVEHPVRAWRQCGTLWRIDDLVAAADFLLTDAVPRIEADELAAEIARMGDTRKLLLTRALSLSRFGPRSASETRLRLLLIRHSLPEPEISVVLRDASGTFVAELDLAYPSWRVAVEYDGRVHAEDMRQFARDADRWDAIRECGWEHVRILFHHTRGDGAVAVRKVREALRRAGWQP